MKKISIILLLFMVTVQMMNAVSLNDSATLNGDEDSKIEKTAEIDELDHCGLVAADCECSTLSPYFTYEEVGGCIVAFSGFHGGDTCLESVGFGWDFDDGFGVLGQNTSYEFSEPGNYVVTLTVSSFDGEDFCVESFEEVIQVTCEDPVECDCRDFDPFIDVLNVSNCEVDLQAIYGGEDCVEGVKYTWNMGDGTELLGQSVTYSFPSSGIYMVTLTVSPGDGENVILDCVESVEQPIQVNCVPLPDCSCESLTPEIIIDEISECEVDLIGVHGGDDCLEGVVYVWDFGDETGGLGANVSHEFPESGTYTIRLIVTASDGEETCTEIVKQEITIDCDTDPVPCDCESLNPEIEVANITGCAVTFQGYHGGDPCLEDVQFRWNFGDGVIAYGEWITHEFPDSGAYTVILTVSYDGDVVDCKEETEELIEVDCGGKGGCECLEIDADVAVNYVSGCIVEFETIMNYTCFDNLLYVWFFGDDQEAVGSSVSHTYESSGIYSVVLALYGLDDVGDICMKEKVEFDVEVFCLDESVYEIEGETDLDSPSELAYKEQVDESLLKDEQMDFTAFPNPSSGLILLELDYPSESGKVEVYSSSGKLVKEKFVKNEKQIELDLEFLPLGVYSIRFIGEEGQVTKRVRIN